MDPTLLQPILERLAAANIEILPIVPGPRHIVFGRDRFVALVERSDEAFGPIGSAGKLVDSGFATLLWRGETPFFVARGYQEPASAEDICALRAFQADLQQALTG